MMKDAPKYHVIPNTTQHLDDVERKPATMQSINNYGRSLGTRAAANNLCKGGGGTNDCGRQ